MATAKKTTTYTAPVYKNKTTYSAGAYKGYKGDSQMAQNTIPNAKKVTTIKGGTKAANQGLNYLNQLDTNLGGLYGNSAAILIDNGALQAIESARKNMQDMTNRQYNDNANTYYQMYRQNQAKLPENLSRLGITGGASETASLNQLNNYSNNLYNNESARANALNEGNMKYDQMIADNSVQLSRQLADMYYNLGKGLLDERRANQRADWEWNRNADYDRYQYNRDVGYDNYKWNRDVDYDRYKFNRDVGYGDYTYNRDITREDQLYNRNIARENELNAYDRALAQAQYTGDFSVMKKFGWSDSDVSKANSLMANSGTSGGSGGYGSYGGYGGYGGSSGSGSGSGSGSDENWVDWGDDEETTSGYSTVPISNVLNYGAGLTSAIGNYVTANAPASKSTWTAPTVNSSGSRNIKQETKDRYSRGNGHAAATIPEKKNKGKGSTGGSSRSRTYNVKSYR